MSKKDKRHKNTAYTSVILCGSFMWETGLQKTRNKVRDLHGLLLLLRCLLLDYLSFSGQTTILMTKSVLFCVLQEHTGLKQHEEKYLMTESFFFFWVNYSLRKGVLNYNSKCICRIAFSQVWYTLSVCIYSRYEFPSGSVVCT